ncbi:MAG: MFS transporter [Gammaproteobacteria bacterium]|nr:MFS transporter [Gammaproteobacteria bacterium]
MPDHLSRHQITVLIVALMTTAMGQSLVFAILAPLGREVQLSELRITSIIAISALIFGLAAPAWGRLSDRVGRKPIIITGLVGYTLGTLAFTSVFYAGLKGVLAGTALYGMLLLARCSQSLIMSATSPASTAYAADHTGRDRRTATMARLGTANSMGTILGPAVSGALATFGLLAPLYFAAAMAAMAALLVWRQLPLTPKQDITSRRITTRLRFFDPRIRVYLATAVGLFVGFSGIQQTLGFQLQDKLGLSGIETAQMAGAALMISAVFTFLIQVTVMQRASLRASLLIRLGLASLTVGAVLIAGFGTFAVLGVGMAFLGTGMGLCMPAIAAGASLAVSPQEQGAAAGLVSSCPAIGFVAGPICAGALYQVHGPLAPLFSAAIFLAVLATLALNQRREGVCK